VLKLGRMSEAAENTSTGSAAGGGNKKLIMIVVAFNILLAAGMAYVVLSGRQASHADKPKHGEEDAHEGEEGEAEGEAKAESEAKGKDGHKKASKFGPLIEVGSFVSNLANNGPGASRYAKVTLHVEVTDEEAKARVEAALVPIRAEALMFFSSAKVDDVVGTDKIHGLADELLKRITTLVGKNTVRRVFFSELVVQ
jgi:flagellar FliL protein